MYGSIFRQCIYLGLFTKFYYDILFYKKKKNFLASNKHTVDEIQVECKIHKDNNDAFGNNRKI